MKYYKLGPDLELIEISQAEWASFGVRFGSDWGTCFGKVTVSTSFIGIEGTIFETAIFGGKFDGKRWHCDSMHDAILAHLRAANLVSRPTLVRRILRWLRFIS